MTEKISWESLRASWVNGNLTAVKEVLKSLHKDSFARITLEAIEQSFTLEHESGDLKDLHEMLAFTFNHYRRD